MLCLEKIRPGQSVRIIGIAGSEAFVDRMKEIGLVPGTVVCVLRRSLFGGTIQVRYGTSTIGLRLSHHDTIEVEPVGQAVIACHSVKALDFAL